jgi:hypothetical protein
MRVYLLRSNDDPAPREVNVVIGWRARAYLLKLAAVGWPWGQ